MKDQWKEIWGKKEISVNSEIGLKQLINADGFDNGVGSYSVQNWRKMVADFCNRVSLKNDANVVEIGCGSGAFLYAARELVDANYYGVDYSKSLIDIAQQAIPHGCFVADEALNQNFVSTVFDVVFSHSVFHYFPHVGYAEEVLLNWCALIRPGGYLVLMDINDVEYEKTYHASRMSEYKNPKEYITKYDGLNHLFLSQQKLSDYLSKIGMSDIAFFPHSVPSYGNSQFRFNLICRR